MVRKASGYPVGLGDHPLIFLGASGNARACLDAALARHDHGWTSFAVLDDVLSPGDETADHLPVLGPCVLARDIPNAQFILTFGSIASRLHRRHVVEELDLPAGRWATIIHPGAHIAANAHIGIGVGISFGSFVGPGVVIGDHALLLQNVIVNHASTVGAFTLCEAGSILAGRVKLGQECYVGQNASIAPDCDVKDGAVIGMAAAVLADVATSTTVAGVPAIVRGGGR